MVLSANVRKGLELEGGLGSFGDHTEDVLDLIFFLILQWRLLVDDLFYFTEQDVNLKKLAELASLMENVKVELHSEGLRTELIPNARNSGVHWAPYTEQEMEPTERQELKAMGIQSAFCMSYHPSSFHELKVLLLLILRKYGGWLGDDSEGFHPRRNLEELEALGERWIPEA
jgi:hypothetical protein